jgi:replicative DNA helicase
MNRETFLTENGCKNPSKDRFEAAKRVIKQAEQLIYAIQDAKEHAGINEFDDMLKPVEELRLAALEYAALIVIGGTIDKLQDKIGGEQ